MIEMNQDKYGHQIFFCLKVCCYTVDSLNPLASQRSMMAAYLILRLTKFSRHIFPVLNDFLKVGNINNVFSKKYILVVIQF